MKYKLRNLLAAALMSIGGCQASWAQTVYAVNDDGDTPGIYSYEIGPKGITNLKLVKGITLSSDETTHYYEKIAGGIYVDGKYYYVRYTQNPDGYTADGFWSYDIENNLMQKIKDLGSAQQGDIFSEEEYDYQTNTMYCGNSFSSAGDKLEKVDPETGNVSVIGKYTFDRATEIAQKYPDVADQIVALAMNYDGELYGVSYWCGLYKIDKATAACSLIGQLDYHPGDAFQYSGATDLFFDNNTDKLYLFLYQHPTLGGHGSGAELVSIDPATAHVTPIQVLDDLKDLMHGNTVTFTVAEASAPQKAQNFTVTAGEKGALTATLSWDNPSKTYGRGGTLEDLDSMIIYRNGVEIHRIANPAIGGHETYTDQLPERGYYAYRLVGVNDMGHGDRITKGTYVGPGNPKSVTNVTVTNEAPNAKIAWKAPKNGVQDSYIDTTSLTYDIQRLPDSVVVAKAVKDTTYTDKTLKKMGKYKYSVIAHAGGYSSTSTLSEEKVLGPAVEVPDTLLNSADNFALWTTIDADGDYSTWQWSDPSPWSFGGATSNYAYTDYAPANWLISPYIHLKANKHYKITFDAKTVSKKIPELISVGMGKGNTIAQQDSIWNFSIQTADTVTLRANLPVVKDEGNYYISLLQRTMYKNFGISVKNFVIAEDHEGYISGKVTANGKPVAGATVYAKDGVFTATTDSMGKYTLSYLPAGTYQVHVKALGYYDAEASSDVAELDTTTTDVVLSSLPVYTISGTVTDVAGDAVKGADVEIYGYNAYSTTTDADGKFSVSGVYHDNNYAITVSKNKLKSATRSFQADGNKTLDIRLYDDFRPATRVVAAIDSVSGNAQVTWSAPANDVVVDRIDDGGVTTTVGMNSGTSKSTFGVVRRTPSQVSGIQYYIEGTGSVTHYSVQVRLLDLDENGNPTNKVLYENTYVPCQDDQWNTYTFPAPVDAPRGYYAAISYDGYVGIGIDGAGDSKKYPFQKNTNCFASDYTTGKFAYIEGQSSTDLHHNFMLRPMAAPYAVAEDSVSAAKSQRFVFALPEQQHMDIDLNSNPSKFAGKKVVESAIPNIAQPRRIIQQRVRYNVYRMKTTDVDNQKAWTLLAEKQQARSYTDAAWKSLSQGVYKYAVTTVYTGDTLSAPAFSDSLGCKMQTKVSVHVATNTPDNEAYGAKVTLVNGGGAHVYTATLDDNGDAVLSDVWKGQYQLQVALDGFLPMDTLVDISNEDSYAFSLKMTENQVKPFNLVIEQNGEGFSRDFIWNYPNAFEDDFENHEDFAINSPGTIGWQYIDGDGGDTGFFSVNGTELPWKNAGSKMAFQVFNPYAVSMGDGYTLADYYSTLRPHSGQKCLMDWAPAGKDENDWIITPKLHFTKSFKYRFYARSYDAWGYPEQLEILYSMTTADPSAFTRLDSMSVDSKYGWFYKEYDIPEGAKYVALRACTPSNKARVLVIDDIAYGYADALSYTPGYMPKRQARALSPRRMPSLDGAYEVYLDGKKVAQQDETEYKFTGLTPGKHTAGVIASYTSGDTEMSTIDFEVSPSDGISTISVSDDSAAEYYNLNGQKVSRHDLGHGVYMVKKGNMVYKIQK